MLRNRARYRMRGLMGATAWPSLSLNFLTTTTLDPRISLSRPSTAYYTNASGVLTSAANNVARFDYSGGTLLGLYSEGQSTNLNLNSSSTTGYTAQLTTLTAAATTAPDGTTTGVSVVPTTANNVHGDYNSNKFSYTAGSTYTLSAYYKYGSGSQATTVQLDATNGATYSFWSEFNVSTGAKTGNSGYQGDGSLTSSSIAAAGSSWYKTQATGIISAGTSGVANFQEWVSNGGSSSLAPSFTGDGSSTFYRWGVQAEALPFSSSVIPTTTTSVTRAADAFTMTGSNFTSWFNPTQGTIVVTADVEGLFNGTVTGTQQLFRVDNGTNSNVIQIALVNGVYNALVTAGGTQQVSIGSGSPTIGATFKLAFSYGPSGFALSINGGNPITGTGSIPTGLTEALLGSGLFGHLKTVRFYRNTYTGSALQRIN